MPTHIYRVGDAPNASYNPVKVSELTYGLWSPYNYCFASDWRDGYCYDEAGNTTVFLIRSYENTVKIYSATTPDFTEQETQTITFPDCYFCDGTDGVVCEKFMYLLSKTADVIYKVDLTNTNDVKEIKLDGG